MQSTLTPMGRIAATSAGPVTEEHWPVLLVVHCGVARVEVGGKLCRLQAGQAIWIPPGIEHRTEVDEDGVVLPIVSRAIQWRGHLDQVRVVTIPSGWTDWFVFQFDWNSHHSPHGASGRAAIRDLLIHQSVELSTLAGGGSLPMPFSREARAVAQQILSDPARQVSVHGLATGLGVSARTLQRQFVNETGLSFSRWRTRCRLTTAANRLVEGAGVSEARQLVGYESVASFTRAFAGLYGTTPQVYAERARAGGRGGVDRGAAAAAAAGLATSSAENVCDEVSAGTVVPRSPASRMAPTIPARTVWDWVLDRHVLWWAYRGFVSIRVGGRRVQMRPGDALWLPAGVSASVELSEGAVLLPLGELDGATSIDPGGVMSLAHLGENFLLHTVVVGYTLFSTGLDRPGLVEILATPGATQTLARSSSRMSGAVAAIAAALRSNPADNRSLADWAARLEVSTRALSQELQHQTGSTFPRWRAHVRMSLARELLTTDAPPHGVSRALGYATYASFSRVFTSAHGVSPTQYRDQVMRDAPHVSADRATARRGAGMTTG